jgi:hypothetical protein
MRGGPLTAKQACRLFRRPDVAILHIYGLDPLGSRALNVTH